MKKLRKTGLLILLVAALFASCAGEALAHSGRTDGSGGHHDNKNASGLGSYHYHCGGYPAHLHTNGYCPYTDVFPTGVSISVEKKTLGIGESVSFDASVWPSYACSDVVSWSCSDYDVISMSGGVIQALNYGSATITATTFNGRTDSVTITVKEVTADYVTVTSAAEEDEVYIGDAVQLSASITPENDDNSSISWSSDNEDVASVNNAGRVKAIAAGTAIISATASNGVVGKFVIDVNEKYVESVDIVEEELSLLVIDTYPLTFSVSPSDATYPDLEWSSSNTAAVEVSEDGTLSAKRRGSSTITATSTNGLTDSVTVSVAEIVAKRIEIAGNDSIVIGDKEQLVVEFIPEDTTVQKIEWSVDDPSVVSIDEDGNVTALAIGETVVTAVQKDRTDEFEIRVIPRAVEKIDISSSCGTRLEWRDTATLTAEVSPRDATYPDIDWESSKPSVVAVDDRGNLEAKAPGAAVITARSEDGCTESVEISVALSVGTILLIAALSLVIVAGSVFLVVRRTRRRDCFQCADQQSKRGYKYLEDDE